MLVYLNVEVVDLSIFLLSFCEAFSCYMDGGTLIISSYEIMVGLFCQPNIFLAVAAMFDDIAWYLHNTQVALLFFIMFICIFISLEFVHWFI